MSVEKKDSLEIGGHGKSDFTNDGRFSQDYERPIANNILIDDKLPAAFARLRVVTPSPRVCVYGLPHSVPGLDPIAASRYFRQGGYG